MTTYCTDFRYNGPNQYGGKFSGPRVEASSYYKAEIKAARLGCIVTGSDPETFIEDPSTGELVPCSCHCAGAVTERRYALECGQNAVKRPLRLYFSIILRMIVYKLWNLADRLDPVESRKNVVHIR